MPKALYVGQTQSSGAGLRHLSSAALDERWLTMSLLICSSSGHGLKHMSTDLFIRWATRDDAPELAGLLRQAGFETDTATIIARLAALESTGVDQVMIAEHGEHLVGLIVLHLTAAWLQYDRPVARITALVIDGASGGAQVGGALVEAAETLARQAGCVRIEASSDQAP